MGCRRREPLYSFFPALSPDAALHCEREEEAWNRFMVLRAWACVNLNKVRPVLFIHSDLGEQELIANLYKFALPGTWTEIKTWFTTNRKSNQIQHLLYEKMLGKTEAI